jgi:MSHA pilin protein MshA
MRKTQQGFTLIELVVVITILGILASLDSNARTAAINGLSGSMRSGAALAHSLYLVAGTAPATVSMEGSSVTLTNGYPTGALLGITAALQDVSSFTATYAAGVATFQNSSTAPTPANCQVVYTTSAAANTAPVITATTTGC